MNKFNIKPLCRFTEIDLSVISDKNFVVTATTCDESWIYLKSGDANKDRVRSDFAKQMNVKFVDTRCKMIKNA